MLKINKEALYKANVTYYPYRTAKAGHCMVTHLCWEEEDKADYWEMKDTLCKLAGRRYVGKGCFEPICGATPDNHICFLIRSEQGTMCLEFTDWKVFIGLDCEVLC